MADSPSTVDDRPSVGKVALASSIGAAIEWYDFFLYGTAAGLVFNKLFFTNLDPTTGTIVSFATFAAGFLARPLGSVVFGHFGDRVGRKKMLIATLIIMGVGTTAIGLLPTYDTIGVAAPVLLVLMRLVQGIGVGGEYGGAVLMAVEYAPRDRRGFFGSWPQAGVPAGLLMASGAFALLSLLPEEAFLTWGWRIAFVASLALVAVGLYIRLQVLETPAFATVRERQEAVKVPFATMLRTQPKEFLLGMGTRWIEGLAFNAFGVLIVSYVANDLGLPQSVGLTGVALASAVGIIFIPIYGGLSDRWGRKPVYTAGVVLTALLAGPTFLLVRTEDTALVWLGIVLSLGVVYTAVYAPLAAFWSELFDTRVRYTGVGSVYQFSGIVASGLTPLIGSVLIAAGGGSPWYFVAYLVVVAVISLVCASFLPETYRRDIMPTAGHAVRGDQAVHEGTPDWR
ncbi:MFS transporter [Prauserella oleivorans]|uniref:MFS transporter n=1 Tax=Prauserella oleivorans TaxID=1478153 RepID=A0ABW5WDG9_9PSEU